MNAGAVIQFGLSDSVEKPVHRIERNYRALLAVAVVLNSQRDMQSLWEAITAEITNHGHGRLSLNTIVRPTDSGFMSSQRRWRRERDAQVEE